MWAVATAIQTIDMAIFTLIVSADLQYFLYFSQWKWRWWLLCVLYSDHDQVILMAFNDNSALICGIWCLWKSAYTAENFSSSVNITCNSPLIARDHVVLGPRIPVPTFGQFNTSNFLMQWFYQRFFLLAGQTFGRNLWWGNFCQSLFSWLRTL